tara:strand:+ start:692 stop:2017 length:1326 start_codon:yes stop_codon:yes gene_type:complete
MATTYLYRDATSATSVTAATISCWVKKVTNGAEQTVWFSGYTADYGQYSFRINFNSDDTLRCMNDDAGVNFKLETNRKFRDTNGWYHICLALDTSESAADRGKLYINGVRETSFSTDTNMSGDQFFTGKSGYRQVIGRDEGGSDDYFDGLMGQFYYIDGTAYQASTFGETDADTGEWKIKTSPTVTMGTNGFLVLKNGNTITDQSSNSNDLTLGGGTLTDMQDCPSDLFATLNSLNRNTNVTFSNCNNTLFSDAGTGGTNYRQNISTLGMKKGKFYAEVKCMEVSAGSQYGVVDITQFTNNRYIGYTSRGYGYMNTGEYYNNGSSVQSSLSTFANPDIISIAFDADNSNVYFRVNGGAWQNSGDPTSGSTGTGALAVTSGHVYAFGCSGHGANPKHEFNFGNGYFGTTQISSEGTNASGVGKFEYDVPTGYTALSTKGMNI